jgi:hypothetical protein
MAPKISGSASARVVSKKEAEEVAAAVAMAIGPEIESQLGKSGAH